MKLIYGIFTLLALGIFDVTVAKSSKIDAVLTESLQRNGRANILVSMKDGTRDILDGISNKSFSSRTERSQAVYDALTSRAQKSQNKVLRFLSTPSISEKFQFVNVNSLWITNQISIEFASVEFIDHLASMDEVSRIHEDEIVQLHHPIEHQVSDDPPAITANAWGVGRIQAPEAWTLFDNSEDPIIVGGIDTGVRRTHEVLNANYNNDGYSWYDAVRGTSSPTDDNGHGTHTMGTIAGQNGIGVAPGARWVACKALNSAGSGSVSSLQRCGQFMICRTQANGQNPDCSRSVHIINNSWGMNVGGDRTFDGMNNAWRAAGIIAVYSIGNSGDACGTVTSPGDGDVIGVGATTESDALAYFSSVGPSFNGKIKPEISAPGFSILSAMHQSDNAYATMSGTSMASPHVAGAIALLLNRNSNLTYEEVRTYILGNTDQNLTPSNVTCGGISDNVFPNYHFGYGRLNVYKALRSYLGI